MRPVLPSDPVHVNEPHVRFVDQGCGLERVVGSLASHVPLGQGVELLVNERNELVERRFVPLAPRDEQVSGVRSSGHDSFLRGMAPSSSEGLPCETRESAFGSWLQFWPSLLRSSRCPPKTEDKTRRRRFPGRGTIRRWRRWRYR